MRKLNLLPILAALCLGSASTHAKGTTQENFFTVPAFVPQEDFGVMQQPADKVQWFRDAKIGMFVHWGIYSAIGRGEWVMENEGMAQEDYRRFAYPSDSLAWFDASDFDPHQWTALAHAMGAGYITLTTMHHDGFALFDSRAHNAFTAKQTLNRDLVREFVDACREDSVRIGFYKTLINWRYPGYYDVTGTDCKKNKFGYTTEAWHKENAAQMKNELYCQMQELLTNYGPIDLVWWDGGWIAQEGSDRDGANVWEPYLYLGNDNPWPVDPMYQLADSTGQALGLAGIVRALQPDLIMNTRSGWIGDFRNEEGSHATTGPIRERLSEKCFCLAKGPWGYRPSDENEENLIELPRLKRMVADCIVRDVNVQINVAPDGHGRIPQSAANRLTLLGDWVKQHADAIYGTYGGPWQPVDNQYGFTHKGNMLYVWLLEDFDSEEFTLPAFDRDIKAKRAYLLDSGQAVKTAQKGQTLTLKGLPANGQIRVVAIELKK